jgi:hypothetical protein
MKKSLDAVGRSLGRISQKNGKAFNATVESLHVRHQITPNIVWWVVNGNILPPINADCKKGTIARVKPAMFQNNRCLDSTFILECILVLPDL